MRKTLSLLLFFSLLCLWINASPAQERSSVLIAYYSQTGHTRAMAEAVARGARSVKNVDVKLLTVTEATTEDLLKSDAVIVGSPVHNANVVPEVLSFMNRWPFGGSPMRDKIGAAFVTSGGISAGEELTQLNILHSMMVFGMIVVGGADWKSAFGASAITGEKPFDQMAKGKDVAEEFKKKGEALGRRVAELAVRWKRAH
ncbi:MAG: flavodoxin family protein [Ignavibacteria bacterium]|nr:flavodoxin family protein [Ignavibacteria bacterium]